MTPAAIRWIAVACVSATLACCGPAVRVSAPPPNRASAASGPRKPAAPKPAPKPGTITHIPLDAFFPLQQSNAAIIYDVRPAFFFDLGHIPGAINWPKGKHDSQLAVRETEIRAARVAKRSLVLYCTDLTCPDSNKVAARLAARGHSVLIFEGGYAAWKAAELPSE